MHKQNFLRISRIVFLTSLVTLFTSCQSKKSDGILKVYVPDENAGVILFTTESKPDQVLIEDTNSVFFVMQTSLTHEWAVVSKMPSDPDQARGVSEEVLLFYVPQKRIVYNPTYGNNAHLIGIVTQGANEQALWFVNHQNDSIPLEELQKICLANRAACSASAVSQDNNNSENSPKIDSISIGGWLNPGVTQEVILSHLGEPEDKGDNQLWDATGTYVQEWRYPSQGLSLNMESDSLNEPKKLRSIKIATPGILKTPESVGIGTDLATVKSVYSDKIDQETSNENQLVVGSLYGGMVISFEDNKVRQIFIGAAAE